MTFNSDPNWIRLGSPLPKGIHERKVRASGRSSNASTPGISLLVVNFQLVSFFLFLFFLFLLLIKMEQVRICNHTRVPTMPLVLGNRSC